MIHTGAWALEPRPGFVIGQRAELMAEKAIRVEPQQDGPLRLAGLRPGGPFRGAGVDHGRQAVHMEDLVPVDVPAEDGRNVPRKGRARDHVRPGPEREVAGTAGRALDAMVKAEELHVRGRRARARLREKCREAVADLAGVRKPGERHPDAVGFQHEGARSVEDVEVPVQREKRVRDAATLVVAREQEDRDSLLGDPPERCERCVREPRGNAAPIQEITAMEEHVHLAGSSGREGRLEALEEVGAAARTNDARPGRQVVTEVRIGEEQEAHGSTGPGEHVYSRGPTRRPGDPRYDRRESGGLAEVREVALRRRSGTIVSPRASIDTRAAILRRRPAAVFM